MCIIWSRTGVCLLADRHGRIHSALHIAISCHDHATTFPPQKPHPTHVWSQNLGLSSPLYADALQHYKFSTRDNIDRGIRAGSLGLRARPHSKSRTSNTGT